MLPGNERKGLYHLDFICATIIFIYSYFFPHPGNPMAVFTDYSLYILLVIII